MLVPTQVRPAPPGDRAPLPSEDATARTHDVLRQLADPARWRILVLLAAEQLSAAQLQHELGAGPGPVARHLRALREAGLVDAARVGRQPFYRLVPGALDDVARQVGMLALAPGGHVPRRPHQVPGQDAD